MRGCMKLISLIDANNNMEPEVYKDYKKLKSVNIRDYEVQSIESIKNFKEILGENYE